MKTIMTSFVFDVVNVAEQELVALLQAAMAEPSMASPLLPDEAKAGCLTRLGTIIAASVRMTNTRTPRLVSGERLFKTGIRIFSKMHSPTGDIYEVGSCVPEYWNGLVIPIPGKFP